MRVTAETERRTPEVIAAWSAVSPFGIGRAGLAAGLSSGRLSAARLDREQWPGPIADACLVPDFSATGRLGRKGTHSMDRATALAVVAVAELLAEAQERGLHVGDDAALVLGTNNGSVQSIMHFTRDSLTHKRPYLVNPAEFPNTVMNCAAGQCAIWHKLRGPNATIAGGRASGLLALNYAIRLQRSGHASTVLCGAVEEFSVTRAWLEHHSRGSSRREATLGEGCALLLLAPGSARSRGAQAEGGQGRGTCTGEPSASVGTEANATRATEVLALEFGLAAWPGTIEKTLVTCIRRALQTAGAKPDEVDVVAPSLEAQPEAEAESRALESVLGEGKRHVISTTAVLGEQHAACATFQIVACLEAPRRRGALALVTSIDRDGLVGCVLLRLADEGHRGEDL